MLQSLKKQGFQIIYQLSHFKRFIRIFSFTSASKIISGLSYSIDMIVLARYILPSMITVYEINKRPMNITYSLIGRHSVALMPLISHAKGSGDKSAIVNLVNKQFKFYTYAALFACFIFFFNYENLITAWTGKGQFAGNTILYLMIGGLFLNLVSYFMSTIGYALGDFKMNSLYNIIRNIFYGIMMFFAAKYYGITGTLVVSVSVTLVADLFFYTYRLFRLGYLEISLIRNSFTIWMIIVPVSFVVGWACKLLTDTLLPANMYFSKLLSNSGVFSFFFIILILIIDSEWRLTIKKLAGKFVFSPIFKLIRE